MNNYIDQFSELLSNPLGDLISAIGRGVGEAQAALDAGSLAQTLEIYKEDLGRSDEEKYGIQTLREIGYQPTFYVIPETEVEVKVSLSLAISSAPQKVPIQPSGKRRVQMMATPINAGNSNRYNLNANVAATVKFKIVPVPTDAVISEMRILPDLVNKPFKDAKVLLASLGLNYKLQESVKEEDDLDDLQVKSTVPKFKDDKEQILKIGDVIELVFE